MVEEEKESRSHEEAEMLEKLVGYYESFIEATAESRELSERDRDYVDHKQWTDEEEAALRKRKQPKTVNNRVRKKINFLRGLERQGRTDPKAFPRTPQHEKDAQAVTDALRFVADNAEFDKTRSQFFENYIVEGTGGVEIIVSNTKKREIEIPHIQWDRIWYDQHSRNHDFSDANHKGIAIWSDIEDSKTAFPDGADVLESAFIGDMDDTFSDRPIKYTDSKRKRVRILQAYYKHKGKWWLAFFTKAGFLLPPTESPYLDEDGEPQCAMELQSAYIDRDGNRYGEPRFMIEQQDAINKRESKMLHLVSQRQTYGNKKSGVNTRQAKAELAKPDGHVEISGAAQFGVDFGIMPTGDMANGQFTLLQEAKREIDETSVNASLTGSDQGDSGRAILAKQSGGQIEITPLFDGKRAFEQRVYRQAWNRIRQFWKDERWVRVTDEEKNVKFVGLNKQITVGDVLAQEFGGIPPEFANDPRLQQVSAIENQVSEIDVDIIIEDAPDVATIQIEQFEALAALAGAGIAFPPEVYIQASQLRDKEKLLTILKGGDNPEAQQQAQQDAEIAKKLTIERETAEIQKIGSEAFRNEMDAMKKQAESMEVKTDVAMQVAQR